MNGMDMMLKSIGFDPETIKKSLTEARDNIMQVVNDIKESQKRIEKKVDTLELMLTNDEVVSERVDYGGNSSDSN